MGTKKRLSPAWSDLLRPAIENHFPAIKAFLTTEIESQKTFYPAAKDVFAAFSYFEPSALKVVILGQDPYHNPGQAHGLSFSVPDGVKPPPSLKNIYKELDRDPNIKNFQIPNTGNLIPWAQQGVLLLNAALTVQAHTPNSHAQIWAPFTDQVIQCISEQTTNVVFCCWGNFAKSKTPLIDQTKHLILTSGHPSPFSVKRFMGNQHFSLANKYLEKHNKTPINWQV